MGREAYSVHLRAQASPAYTLWTCWEIGGDILSDIPGREERRDILTSIMRALNWPKGSIAFAPLSSPSPGSVGLEPDLDLFRIYMKRISPVYLFCFGTRGRDILVSAPEFTADPDQAFASKPLFVLPGLQEMISGDRNAKAMAWQTLKRFSP
ncbi:MAG: hypothetical protein EOM25_06240 [Deltaproteobacteria bacterium]|nr:hypothetical protein [Deltaproteobacteria bacterium]